MAQITLNSSGVASSGSLLLQTNGTTTQATVDTSGNLGLGVTPSAWASNFRASQIGQGAYIAGRTDAVALYVGSNGYWNGSSDRYIANGFASDYTQGSGQHIWRTAASGTAGNAITFTQAMTLDASGNLALGTTSPARRLDVRGASSSFGNFFLVDTTSGTTGTGGGVIFGSDDGAGNALSYAAIQGIKENSTASNTQGALLFITKNSGGTQTERARIDSSGNLLVGTTTAVEKLTVAGNISINTSGNPFLQIKTSGAGNNPYIRLQADTATWDIQGTFSNAGDELYLIYGGSNRGYFNSSTGAYTAVSDQRLKKEVTDITYGLSAVMALHPVEYLMNNESNDAQKHLGFIAQEAQSAVPSSVSEMTDGILGMDKTEIIAVLVKGMQEQQAIITQLQADVAALKGQA